MTLEVDCGSLQPGRRIWTDETYLGIGSTCTIELHGKIYASNLTKPHEFTRKINADIQETTMTVEELIKLSKQFGSERD
jgi:hypothetical protein